VQILNTSTATPKRRVPEDLLFSNTCNGPPNVSRDEVRNLQIQ